MDNITPKIATDAQIIFYYDDYYLSVKERILMSIVVTTLATLAIIGNGATLVVCKMRPLFRTCLINLAISDIISALVTTLVYLPSFISFVPVLWVYSESMCRFLPCLKIFAILVNNITIAVISLDRYLSLKIRMRGLWEPGGRWCIIMTLIVWGATTLIAIPTYSSYRNHAVAILKTDKENSSIIREIITGYTCRIKKADSIRYFAILFSLLFIPMICAFIFFNIFVAINIWSRRKKFCTAPLQHRLTNQPCDKCPTDVQSLFQSITSGSNKIRVKQYHSPSNHEKRQLRLFFIVLVLIFTYLALNLPEWIFLLLTMYNAAKVKNAVLIHFILGCTSMSTSVYNPLLYAFVTQTIQYIADLGRTIRKHCCFCCEFEGAVSSRKSSLQTAATSEDGRHL